MDAAFALARNVVNARYEDIPPEAVETTKKEVLDTLACIVAGSKAAGGPEIAGIAREWGGRGKSTIVVHGGRVSPPFAALANGAMGHALDYDDTYEEAPVHAGVSAVPAAFAIAEQKGGVSGKELITAVTVAVDMMCRLAHAQPPQEVGQKSGAFGWHPTAIYGFFGAAAAAGRLLGLDEERMVDAFGITYSQAAGNGQCVADSALTKRMQAGFAAKGGVLSALMAQRGITGAKNSLEGEAGLFNLYFRGGYHPAPLTAELGKSFRGANMSFKPYPCCRRAHAYIDATKALLREHKIASEDIEEIIAFIGDDARHLCEPLEAKLNPRTVVDLQFNIPYAVATTIVKGKVVIDDFMEASIKDPAISQLARKVKPRLDPELNVKAISPGILIIRARGREYSKKVDFAYGHPSNPMSWEDLADKFRDCAAHAAKPLLPNKVERAIEMIGELEEMDDVSQVIRQVG